MSRPSLGREYRVRNAGNFLLISTNPDSSLRLGTLPDALQSAKWFLGTHPAAVVCIYRSGWRITRA